MVSNEDSQTNESNHNDEVQQEKPKSLIFKIYRGILVLLLILVVVGAVVTFQVNGQRQVVSWIQENGGSVVYEIELNDEGRFLNPDEIKEQKSLGWLLDYVGKDYVSKIAKINLKDGVDFDVNKIKGQTQLRELGIGLDSGLTDIGFVSEMKNLERLSIAGNPVEDVTPIKGLAKLRTLDISKTQVSDLSPIGSLPELASLYISDMNVDLAPLGSLPKLNQLRLSGATITDLSAIGESKTLSILDLSGSNATDVTPLSKCENLQYLDLHDSKVTDISALKDCKALKQIKTFGTSITEQNVNDLKEAHGSVQVMTKGYVTPSRAR